MNLTHYFFQTKIELAEIDKRLNMTTLTQNTSAAAHIPYGLPFLYHNDTVCVLYHEDFLSGYNHNTKMVLWTAYTLNDSQVKLATLLIIDNSQKLILQ